MIIQTLLHHEGQHLRYVVSLDTLVCSRFRTSSQICPPSTTPLRWWRGTCCCIGLKGAKRCVVCREVISDVGVFIERDTNVAYLCDDAATQSRSGTIKDTTKRRTTRAANCSSSSRWSRKGLNAASLRGGPYILKKLPGILTEKACDSMAVQ